MLLEKERLNRKLSRFANEIWRVYFLGRKIHIPFLVLSVGQACTLKCKECANFSPYAPKENLRYKKEDIISNLSTLFSMADVGLIQIQGGEPFVYSDIADIIDSIPRKTKIRIATNGTVIPSKRVIKTCLKRNITVRISDYRINVDISRNIQNTYETLKTHGVKTILYSFSTGKDMWYKETPDENKDFSRKEAIKRYSTCSFGRNCLTLENGMLGYCSRSIIALKIQSVRYRQIDYLKINEQEGFNKNRLFQYVNWRHYMECCKLCMGCTGDLIPAAEQI